jgi:hypothetical protein
MRGKLRGTSRRRMGIVAGLFALAVLVQAAVVLAGGSSGTSRIAAVSGSAPVAMTGQSGRVYVGHSYKNDVSPALREIPALPLKPVPEREASPNPRIGRHRNAADPVVQRTLAPAAMPAPTLNFDGIPFPGVACNCAPPDTNGEPGATQYVQIVNEGFQVFNKTTGASVFGPAGIATLWNGFGGVCQNNGAGDPVVLYDQIANRWVITQFAGVSVPTDECIAVSTTSDATGTWFRYGFHLGTNFFDYPKLAVWPDAYYMSMNVFNSAGTAFLGPQPFAFNRAAMLVGSAATFVTTGITGGSAEETYLPADLDGSTLPPAGAPETFVEWPNGGAYRIYHFHVDFGTPSNSTFTLFATPAAAGFTQLCPTTRACVPEPNNSTLDAIADRMMFRAAYRNFGDHESLVTNYTVSSGGVAGIRWIELRNVTTGPVTVFQQSTYQPDTTWRWMGSAAMDASGDLALGFSASSATTVPQLRYAGRLVTDPLNQLAQGEATLFGGAGSQTATSNRWGDYSDLTIDPVDDCTFWYTNEYYPAGSSSFNWRTRIGSFKFPSCGGPPPPPPPPPPVPVSQITGTAATCSQFSAGTATTLPTLTYTARNGRIRSVSPSGFEYWVRVNAAAGPNTAVISQSITTGNFGTLFGQGAGSTVNDPACSAVSGATFTAASGNGTFTVQWNAASAGTYYIGLSLSTSAVKRQPAPSPPIVHYAFSTGGVTGSTTGVDLSP